MKKFKIILIILCSLAILQATVYYSGMLKMYKMSSVANEPGLKMGSRTFITNLTTPKYNDFVCFKTKTDSGSLYCIFRLVGLENDIIEIKHGTLFRNGKNVDATLRLMHCYKLPINVMQKIQASTASPENFTAYRIGMDSALVHLEDK